MKTVNIIGNFFDNHSLSIVNRRLAIGLDRCDDIRVSIRPTDRPDPRYRVSPDTVAALQEMSVGAETAPDIEIRHSFPPLWRWPESDRTRVVFIQPWEFRQVPFEWQYRFETFADALITPSAWSARRFLDAGLRPEKLVVIPNGYNPRVFNRQGRSPDSDVYQFVYVGCDQWRKGLDILLKAWTHATRREEPVRLVVKDNPDVYGKSDLATRLDACCRESGCGSIVYCGEPMSEAGIGDLYRASHCVVHPYRGEGFAMHVQEAMACGCFPLVSGDGPTDEFVRDADSKLAMKRIYLEPERFRELIMMPGHAFCGMELFVEVLEPDVADLVTKIRSAIDGRRQGGAHAAKLSTWHDVTARYADVIRAIDMQGRPARFSHQRTPFA